MHSSKGGQTKKVSMGWPDSSHLNHAEAPVAEMDFNHSLLGVGVPFCTTSREGFEDGHVVETTSTTGGKDSRSHQAAVLGLLATALRKSLVTCSVEVETDDDVTGILDISWPTDVTHVSHVTFDRFDGFLGLPSEFQSDFHNQAPSASLSAFGVSAKSMQCTYDNRGNSVPTILLLMQKRLYNGGGLKAEGIFRVNAESNQEIGVREQLNKGIVPHGIDVHCLASLIKAWFRELPGGVLDCLAPEKVMRCTTEDEYLELVKLLPLTEAALLDWAIDLMADVVQEEAHNKMNARNIAMVFAPNMTQMDDPLTALIHAVKVMNFLKILIVNRLREREQASASLGSTCSELWGDKEEPEKSKAKRARSCLEIASEEGCCECEDDDDRGEEEEEEEKVESPSSISSTSTHVIAARPTKWRHGGGRNEMRRHLACGIRKRNGSTSWLRRGVWKLCRHPVFQLSRTSKRSANLSVVRSRGRVGG